jgi:hypothetical protein
MRRPAAPRQHTTWPCASLSRARPARPRHRRPLPWRRVPQRRQRIPQRRHAGGAAGRQRARRLQHRLGRHAGLTWAGRGRRHHAGSGRPPLASSAFTAMPRPPPQGRVPVRPSCTARRRLTEQRSRRASSASTSARRQGGQGSAKVKRQMGGAVKPPAEVGRSGFKALPQQQRPGGMQASRAKHSGAPGEAGQPPTRCPQPGPYPCPPRVGAGRAIARAGRRSLATTAAPGRIIARGPGVVRRAS